MLLTLHKTSFAFDLVHDLHESSLRSKESMLGEIPQLLSVTAWSPSMELGKLILLTQQNTGESKALTLKLYHAQER